MYMVNFVNTLKKKYDKEIRLKCKELEKKIEECMHEHYDDEFVCSVTVSNFNKCIKEFDDSFKKKYKRLINIPTYNLPE
jgi:hypothetical protein